MSFEWDEYKRHSNLKRHHLDFRDVQAVFEEKHIIVPSSQDHGEQRFLAIGKLDGKFVTVVYTMRSEKHRIISFRRSRDAEKRRYQDVHGRRT